jgi:tetratricopeptide (TPR) repeat protein
LLAFAGKRLGDARVPNRASQIRRLPACVGAAGGLRLGVALGLLLQASAAVGAAIHAAEGATPSPSLTILSAPPVIVPGELVRVRLDWSLIDPAEPDPTPTTDLGEALLQWGPMTRSETGVFWEGELVPLLPGSLEGRVTCSAALPVLPTDMPSSTVFSVPPRYLANLYSPCRSRRLARSVALPSIAVVPLPPAPPEMPPFSGLLGLWSATLTADRTRTSRREPLSLELCLRGRGSATLFRPPSLSHPDLEVLTPTLERAPTGEVVQVRWTVIPTRVPLEPLRLEFSSFDRTRYLGHRLELALNVLPEPPPQAGAPLPPPVLLRFHPMPPSAAPAVGRELAGAICAGLGALAGLTLAGAARRRDRQNSPEGLRRAALKRLRQTQLSHADELPRLYRDLHVWLELPGGAATAEIDAALRLTHPELADELRALETRRFSAAADAAVTPPRLQALLKRLTVLAVLAVLSLGASAALPPEESLSRVAEEAFRQRDFAQACNALTLLRQRRGESTELLLNLANAYWFTARRVEALALYERAVRQAPRRQDSRYGLAWLRTQLPAQPAPTATPWTLPLRDRLRPDEWVFLAGLLSGLGCFAGGLLRWWRRPPRYALGIAAIATCGCLWFALAQWTGTYRVGATARLTQALVLRAAPAIAAEPLTPVLPAGTLVTPSGAQADWLRVRTATAEGWAPKTECILVW